MNYNGRKNYFKKSKKKKNDATKSSTNKNKDGDNASPRFELLENNQSGMPSTLWKLDTVDSPYYGWKWFFPDEEYKDGSLTVRKLRAIEVFIDRQPEMLSLISLESLDNGTAFSIDLHVLNKDEMFLREWPNFSEDMLQNPSHTIECFKLAIQQKIISTLPQDGLKNLMSFTNSLPAVRLKILNHRPIMYLRDVKVNSYGKLITTRGCVIRVGHIRHLLRWVVFLCVKCNFRMLKKQPDGIFTTPKKCHICGASKFEPILDSPDVKSVPFRRIKIQELLNDEQENKGKMPRILDVHLFDELADTCMPGDDITLTGIMKGTNDTVTKGPVSNSFALYMEAVTVINGKQSGQTKSMIENEMNMKDYLAVKEIYDTPNIFLLLIQSLCPSIYGHDMIKAGLILSLFGGNSKHSDTRGDIHVLVVGDPGLGKSQMLQACTRVAEKGVYVCGNSSTSSGLTVTLTKETGSNDFALEPGALVMADRSCCCIDEFDKMASQHTALLESMEQQSVSVAKSGIICSLPARTSIIAAANPIGGRYDRSKTILQNLNISQPLLSRFDLVFLLLDQPDEYLDDLLCKHVMTIHSGANAMERRKTEAQPSTSRKSQESSRVIEGTLRERLATCSRENIDIIPQPILRKFVSYARRYVHPILSKKAAEVLQEYYLELRAGKDRFGGLYVCIRQLEAMIRLTEARAKLELRTEATVADALDVVEILRYSMNTLDNDLTPNLPSSDDGKLTNNKVKQFISLLKNDEEKTFTMNRLKEIAVNGKIIVADFTRLVERLNDHGILLKTGGGFFKFVSD